MEDTRKARAPAGTNSPALRDVLGKSPGLNEKCLGMPNDTSLEPNDCFTQIIQAEGSSEQQSLWLELVRSDLIQGSYAETELGHEGFFEGAETETTAILDTSADDFVIRSPALSSIKFYPTGLHPHATHTIVPSRLYVGSRDHGVYLFIVPIRHPETLQTYPGVRISGEGVSAGSEPAAGTCIYFANARAPRSNLLNRAVGVTKDGRVTKSHEFKDPVQVTWKHGASTAINASLNLAKAVAIATRYAALRTQGRGHYAESPTEVAIIYQPLYYSSLLNLITQTYACFLAAKQCLELKDLLHGKSTAQAAYTAALTSGLKAYITDTASSGVASAQRTCGILGWSALSSLPSLVTRTNSLCVRHGENQRLYQETATYLMHTLAASKRYHEWNAAPEQLSWLFEAQEDQSQTTRALQECTAAPLDLTSLLRLFRRRAVDLLFKNESHLLTSTDLERRSLGRRKAWDKHVMSLTGATKAFLEAVVLETFIGQTENISDKDTRDVLSKVCLLWGLNVMLASPASFGAGTLGETVQVDTTGEIVSHLHEDLLPHALALINSWEFKGDEVDESALAASDGNVYGRFVREMFGPSETTEREMTTNGETAQEAERKQLNGELKVKSKL